MQKQSLHDYVSRHWQGEHPIWFSLLISLLGLRLILGSIPLFTNNLANYAWLLGSLAVLAWQVRGAYFCAKSHYDQSNDGLMQWAAYAAIIITITLTTLQALDRIAGPAPKITEDMLDRPPPPRLSEDGGMLFLTGDISYDLSTGLQQRLAQPNKVHTVVLQSNGGMIYAARALALNIGKHGLNTHVNDECNSACSIVFMAGRQRTLGPQGKIGFHQYQYEKLHPLQTKKLEQEQQVDRNFFISRGINSKFVQQIYQSEHQAIWQPSLEQLRAANVITHIHN